MTATAWTFGGTALTTYGTITAVDDYLSTAERRGDDILIPFKHGRIFTQKYYDSRKITFYLIKQAASAAALETSINALRAKIAPRTEQTLSMTMEDTTVRTISATVNAPLQVHRETPNTARIVVEFSCALPYWRMSTEITTNETTINASPKAMTVTNPGGVEETTPTIVLTGPLSNTVITNSTNGYVLTYTGTIASPRVVTLSVSNGEWIASDDLAANKISNFTHSGGSELMKFDVGTNTLAITDGTATTGKVRARFFAPFL
jgi:phage-related protein